MRSEKKVIFSMGKGGVGNTPVYEAMRLEEDLKRAQIATKWWVIKSSLFQSKTTNKILSVKADNEIEWINKVDQHSSGNFAIILWYVDLRYKTNNRLYV